MPKERFHIFLAERLIKESDCARPVWIDLDAFFIGAVSPDIFYYDLPFFSLSPLGDRLHSLVQSEGICLIFDWLSKIPFERANAQPISWALGFICHFMVDALWHPLIEQLSKEGLCTVYSGAKRLSTMERHRLIESELEAYWFAKACEGQKKDYLPPDFSGRQDRLLEIFSPYRSFIDFASRRAHDNPASPLTWPKLSEKRIAHCFLHQRFLLRLFANKTAAKARDPLLSFSPTRFLGALIVPARPLLPALFSRAMPEQQNPFSDLFMNRAFDSLKEGWRARVGQIDLKT
ncbi:MAG: zinc dependent phospholipase C family protein [Syntrophobacteraceae bacterium]